MQTAPQRSAISGSYQVDKSRGELTVWRVGGNDLVCEPLAPLLFRAPTDNDRGGSGGTSYLDRWKEAGIDRLDVQPESCRVATGKATDVAVEVTAEWTLVPNDAKAPRDASEGGIAGVSEV